jgi:hypothetical protein
MSITKKLLQAASGNAGGDNLYVEDVFSTYLYEGNSSTQTITNGIDLAGEGGLVWIKARNSAATHGLYDTERGATKRIDSTTSNGESTYGDSLTSFDASGFSIGARGDLNQNSIDFASWSFRKAEKFFDVVTWTGNGVAGRQIPHSLGSVPGFIITKRTDSADNWKSYHVGNPSPAEDYVIELDNSNAAGNEAIWNDTAPTSTNFTVSAGGAINANSYTYVAYLFASDAGGFGEDGSENIIKCGSYTGAGGGTPVAVNLGFEPQFMLIKSTVGTGDWNLFDNSRGVYTGGEDARLWANKSDTESFGVNAIEFTATGCNIIDMVNNSSDLHIYIAIRRPMKTPESGTEVFASPEYTGNGSAGKKVTSNINMASGSMAIFGNTSSDGNFRRIYDSLRGPGKFYYPNDPRPESTDSTGLVEFLQDGVIINADSNVNGSGGIYSMFSFKRATGFFDIASRKSTQTGVQPAQYHNLGVVPEMIISKSDSSGGFYVYHSALGLSKHLSLDSTNAQQSFAAFGSTLTATRFQDYATGSNQQVINYLFATLAGVSKVGSYTGTTGSDVNVDCGFSAGARFVMIKRTNSTGGWYVWDSVRGIISGDDPYLLLNDTDAEVTNTDYIDPLSSGFTVTAAAPAQLNTTNDTYIFLAIA